MNEHELAVPGSSDESDDDLRSALAGLSLLATGSLSLSEALTHVAEFAVRAIPGADGAGVTLLHDDRADTVVASTDFVRDVDDIQYSIEEGPCITAARTGVTVRSGSLGAETRWPAFGSRVGRLGVHSVLSLPLRTPDGVVGAMNVYARAKNAFDEHAEQLGEYFAGPAAISVQNARALASAVLLAQRLEKALTNRAVIDHAIGILISRSGYSQAEAFNALRTISQQDNRKLNDVARSLVDDAGRRARARHTNS